MSRQKVVSMAEDLRELLERIADPYRREPRSIHLHNADIAELRARLDASKVTLAGTMGSFGGLKIVEDPSLKPGEFRLSPLGKILAE